MSSIITVQNLKVCYDQRVILENINFDVYAGDIFLIIGGSGCGKTTLLNALIGLNREVSGKIVIDGEEITKASDSVRQKMLKKIGVMYQGGALFGSLTLLENVMFPLEELSNLPKDAIKAIATSKLETVGLGDFVDYMPTEISGGMQKRASIARAMVFEPKIIFLDEPFSGLDPTTAAQIDKLILMLSQILKITFVVVTHELASIFNIGTRVIMLHEKKIIVEGNPNDLHKNCTNSVVQKFFNRQA